MGSLVVLDAALSRAGERIRACARDLRKHPDDPEALHQYRISLRVGRSLLSFVSPYLRNGYRKEVVALLRRLQGHTSELRELDVMFEELSDEGAQQVYSDAEVLLAACSRRRDKVRGKFLAYFASKKTKKQVKRVEKLLSRPQWRRSVKEEEPSEGELRELFLTLADRFQADFAACDLADVEATHALRKRAKQLRYIARELGDLLGSDCLETGEKAKSFQELLGGLCDARVNLDYATRLLGEDAAAEGEGSLPTYAQAQRQRADALLDQLKRQVPTPA